MPKQKIILKGIPLYKIFPVLKKIPYRTFYRMPKRFEEVPEVYSLYFNLTLIKVKDFVQLFLSSPKKYEILGRKGIRETIKVLEKIKEIRQNYWQNLKKEEKISLAFALLHTYWASWTEDGIYETMIDCPPAGFNIESLIPQNKLKILERIKEKCTKEYEKFDLYDILVKLMEDIKKIVQREKEFVKKKYRKEMETIFKYRNFTEMMMGSIFQLLYKYPGIFRFRQPIPKIFLENVKYVAPTKKYFIFPIKKEGLGELKGLGASPGKTKGKVKICHQPEEAFKKIKKGEILVCPKTDPSWVPILQKVFGIITEGGGLLSHAAIVSREFKIPCIVGVRGILKRLKDGDLIEMDGKTGEIKILEKVK